MVTLLRLMANSNFHTFSVKFCPGWTCHTYYLLLNLLLFLV